LTEMVSGCYGINLSACFNASPTAQIDMKFYVSDFLENLYGKIPNLVKIRYFTWSPKYVFCFRWH